MPAAWRVFAVQMPRNFSAAAWTAIGETAPGGPKRLEPAAAPGADVEPDRGGFPTCADVVTRPIRRPDRRTLVPSRRLFIIAHAIQATRS